MAVLQNSYRRRRQRKAEEAVAYVLHAARSWAQLRASPADKPQSEQIWCSQVIGGRPRDLHQFGKGGTPSRTSHATRRTALAGTLSGIRATWPNSERRRRRTIDWILCRPDLVQTSAFVVKSDHLMPRILLWGWVKRINVILAVCWPQLIKFSGNVTRGPMVIYLFLFCLSTAHLIPRNFRSCVVVNPAENRQFGDSLFRGRILQILDLPFTKCGSLSNIWQSLIEFRSVISV